jgi:hypothetical protein
MSVVLGPPLGLAHRLPEGESVMTSLDTTVAVIDAAARSQVPVLLWSDPGMGKSSVVRALAAADGVPVETVIGSQREPVDIFGRASSATSRATSSPPTPRPRRSVRHTTGRAANCNGQYPRPRSLTVPSSLLRRCSIRASAGLHPHVAEFREGPDRVTVEWRAISPARLFRTIQEETHG